MECDQRLLYIHETRKREKTTDIYLSLNEYFSSTNKGIHTHILNKLPIKRTKKMQKFSPIWDIKKTSSNKFNMKLCAHFGICFAYCVICCRCVDYFYFIFCGDSTECFDFFNNGVTKLFKPEQCNDRMFIRDTKKRIA